MRLTMCIVIGFAFTLRGWANWVTDYEHAEHLLDGGRVDEATSELRILLRERPNEPVILDALGRAEMSARRYLPAANYFERETKIGPPRSIALANWALACWSIGQYGRAELLVRNALGLAPDQPEILKLLGQILIKERRYAEALPILHRALDLGHDPSIWNDIGAVHWDQHQPELALKCMNRAIQEVQAAHPRARIRANLGILQWNLGDRAQGVQSLGEAAAEMAAAVGPNHPDTGYTLEAYSQLLRKSGRKAEAREAHARAEQILSAFALQTHASEFIDIKELSSHNRR